MKNQTTYYKIRKELLISIKQTIPELIKFKKDENKIAFNKLLQDVVPDIRSYIIKRVKTAIQKNHFPKNKYVPNDFIDQLYIETYDNIENLSNEDEFYVWLYKKTNELLDDAITEEEFDDLFFTNIDNYSKQEWDQMEENFTVESDGDLIMNEELTDISYHQNPYTIKDVFLENTESDLIKKIDKALNQEQVNKHVQFILHNLPLQTQNVFELLTKHHLTLEEIAEVSNISITETKKYLDDGRKLLKTSLLNRYNIY
ncbi:RNA polymerase sigma factor [Formosa sp. L2A11]|uniref:RNA polymerase sigma factor n=1 Tax=Formosa sp. L2A11 TaxID=2686363 RepID=UPI00131D78D9|nr:sigma-70 family RNA polymerase sigma factor [Formosa sp. L2A11]